MESKLPFYLAFELLVARWNLAENYEKKQSAISFTKLDFKKRQWTVTSLANLTFKQQ